MITQKELKEKISSDGLDVVSGAIRSQVRRLIRKDILDRDLVEKLWDIDAFRWDLARRQELPDSIKIHVIKNHLKKSNKTSKAAFKEVLKNGKNTESIVKEIETHCIHDKADEYYYIAWSSITSDMIQWADFDIYIDSISKLKERSSVILSAAQNPSSFNPITQSIISICQTSKSHMDTLLSLFSKDLNSLNHFLNILNILAKSVYFEDYQVNELYSIEDEEENESRYLLFPFMETLIRKNNCSKAKKARFLLENTSIRV